MEKKEYSVSEAVRLIGVESHVLRYWEEELQVEIRRTSQGHRIYSQENIETFCMVKELKEYGLQLKAIRYLLEKTGGNKAKTELTEQIFEIGGAARKKEESPGKGSQKEAERARNQTGKNEQEEARKVRDWSGEDEQEEEEVRNWPRENEQEETERVRDWFGENEQEEAEGVQNWSGESMQMESEQEEDEENFWEEADQTGEDGAEGSPILENDENITYDIAITPIPEDDFDRFRQFEEILKRIIGEIIEEKNQKMELSFRKTLREELDEFFLLYQDIVSEAAAEREERSAKKGFFEYLRDFWRR